MITLREIHRDNFEAVVGLAVFDGQKHFVASNIYSLAQAKAQPECVPLAIYHGDEPVGFVMYCMDFEDKEYWIYRLMMDQKHQRKGYGRMAMQRLLARIAEDTKHDKVYVSFEPTNAVAQKLYESFGFIPDGRIIDGEIVYCLHRG